ncbi:MAG: hypothetical protein JSW50_14990, partial [Candidatus Latescibacterota bacterium]
AGLGYVRKLRASEWKKRRWHLERYFIREWVEAEQMATNFGGLVRVVEDQFIRRKQQIPLSFYYKYATALEKSGDFDGCRRIVNEGKRRVGNTTSETYHQLLLEEANLVFRVESDKDSCHILDQIDVNVLSPYHRARVYVIYVLNYRRTGMMEKYTHFMNRAIELSERFGFTEHILRLNHEEGWLLLSNSFYSEAISLLRRSIRLAQRHREYRALSMVWFLASAVYYEEGLYQKALKLLGKSIDIAKQMGLEEQVSEFRLRYAMIHQNLGYYGNAIRYAESAKRSTRTRYDREQLFYATLIVFESFICIHSSRAPVLKEEVDALVKQIREPYRLGLYYRLLGVYYYKKGECSNAWDACENARGIYKRIGYKDDVARVNITMVRILLKTDQFEKAKSLLANIGIIIGGMQSPDIKAEHALVSLERCVRSGADRGDVLQMINKCEEIRPNVMDANVALQLDLVLFRGCLVIGDYDRASGYFREYYDKIKSIVGNLPGNEYVTDFLRNADFVTAMEEFKRSKKKRSGQSLHD